MTHKQGIFTACKTDYLGASLLLRMKIFCSTAVSVRFFRRLKLKQVCSTVLQSNINRVFNNILILFFTI